MEDQKGTVRAVERALDILLCFQNEKALGLTEIANRVSLHKSTVYRLLASLEHKGFVVRDAINDKYRLGLSVWELAMNLDQDSEPAIVLLPEMERLRDLLEETITLYIRHGLERVRVQTVESHQPIRRVAPLGAKMPLHVGASSKVLVAFLNTKDRNELIKEMVWANEAERVQYKDQLQQIQKQGFATSIEEREVGAAAVSAPIFNRSGQLVAALAVSGPANRFTLEKMEQHVPVILESTRRMSRLIV